MSSAVAAKVVTAPDRPVASSVRSPGTVTVGGVVSRTVTSKCALPSLPAASLAVQVTRVVPKPKLEPDAGEHDAGTEPSTASSAVALKVATAPEGPVASIVSSAGTTTSGGVASSGAR